MKRFLIKKVKSDASSTRVDEDISIISNEANSVPQTGSFEAVAGSSKDKSYMMNIDEKKTSKAKKKYKQKFRSDWKSQFKWAEPFGTDGTSTKCIVCNIRIIGSVTHLKLHEKSVSHRIKEKAARSTPSMEDMFKPEEVGIDQRVKEAELKCTMFLIEHNLPFMIMDHLPKLISSVCPDSKIASKLCINRKKATQLTVEVLGPANLRDTSNDLKENHFSLIIDETTDISTSKSLALVARYYKNNQVVDRFLDLIEVDKATAECLFGAIRDVMLKNGIPFENVIGFGADNCSVMMGHLTGMKALFKSVNPNIVIIGCTCHSFHLCSSAACEKLPKSIEQFSRDVYNYFSNSSKRCSEFKECQIFLKEKTNVILRPSQTRWLSYELVINRILEHWSSLDLFFTAASLEDNVQSAHAILNALKNPVYKLYFYFLSYALDIINKLNIEFQSEKTKIHVLLNRVTGLYRMILKSFIKSTCIKKYENNINNLNVNDPDNYLPLEELYCGAKARVFINETNIDKTEVKNFRIRVLDYYVELARQIKKRFDFNDKVLIFAQNFDPKTVMTGNVNSICEAVILFPYLNIDIEKIDFEYRLLSETNELKKCSDDITEFWYTVSSLKNSLNEHIFENIFKLSKIIMCLPHSSAAAERIFSQLNLVKTRVRNRLLIKTCQSILQAKDMLRIENKKCFTWQPPANVTTYSNKRVTSTEVLEEDIF